MKRLILALAGLLIAGSAHAQQPGIFRQITGYTVTYTGTAGTGQVIGSQTRAVRVLCTTACLVAFPVTPIAAAATRPVYLPAVTPEYFKVTPGTYAYVVQVTSGGTLYVTEVE